MKRIHLIAPLLLAAACSGSPKKPPNGGGSGSPTAVDAGAPITAPVDPHLSKRMGWQDPGGMWMPRQMKDQAALLADLGLQLDASQLSDPTKDPLAAVISLRTGGRPSCTASFVSADGLIVTNHHCAQIALQNNSSADHNLVEDGFLARTKDAEVPAGASEHIWVAQKISDVTGQMRDGLDAIKDANARHDEFEKRQKALVASCEQDRPDTKCQLASFFNNSELQLIEYLEIKDLRLVYVPKRPIGDYGGEIDNWAWPRHTGDWSFFRAYVGKDGKPADFSPDNVPYRPASYLKVANGLAEHDLVFVAGYPGRTSRQQTAAELQHGMDFSYPHYIEKANQKMDLLAELQKAGGDTAIKAGVTRQMTQNGLEKYQGIYEGLQKSTLGQEKVAEEAAFRAWAAEDPSRAKYTDALDAIQAKLTAQWKLDAQEETWRDTITASQLLNTALYMARWADEHTKPDDQRRPGYQDRDRDAVMGRQKTFARGYDPAIDRAFLKLMLTRATQQPATAGWMPGFLGLKKGAKVDAKAIDKALDAWYGATKLADEAVRTAMLDAKPATLKKSKDPFVKLAVKLLPDVKKLEKRDDALWADLVLLYPTFIEGMMAFKGGMIAPDANSTLRVSYGTVRGYRPSPDAAMYAPFTKITEIPKKDTGVEPFNAPKEELAAIAAGKWGPYAAPALGEVPVNFLSDLDITGGNSGSPVMNARGELVGLAFDGNYEGLASDVVFKGETTRTITCDIRYVLWVADAVDQADNVVAELGFTPAL